MKKDRYASWIHNIYHTQAEEINCSECFELVSRYVELEVTGSEPERKLPQVVQHLQQCTACREEYETLRDLRRLEEQGDAPTFDDLRASIR